MKTSERGLNLIKKYEGLRLEAYLDPCGIPTIGWGHTSGVRMGDTINEETAHELLKLDVSVFEKKVLSYDEIYHFNQNEFDALVSFAYNLGSIKDLVKNGSVKTKSEIADRIPLFCNATINGKKVKLRGLVERRNHERALFLEPCDYIAENVSCETLMLEDEQKKLEIAFDAYKGKYGNGLSRQRALKKLGYDAAEIQQIVNNIYVAYDVISGEYGNGEKREKLLNANGYDYRKIQNIVNYIMRKK